MDVVALAGLLVRATVGTYPFSGQGKPPLYGDLEAQRHWIEVTWALPLRDWYRNTTANDLQYWGLDYPPLTAFWSLAVGAVGALLVPQAVAWESSRGAEDAGTIAFMRGSVLVADVLVYIPAAWLFVRCTRSANASRPRLGVDIGVQLFAALVFFPALLLVDHGHFQYNGVSLGLAALAVAAAASGRRLWAAAAFACALNYKQMLLYYAPAWFVFLLAESCRGRGASPAPAAVVVWRVAALALVVAVVFGAAWLPFCISSTADPSSDSDYDGLSERTAGASSWVLRCGGGLAAVLSRLFPFSRSVFEDKVASLWCAAEPLLKLRERTYADASGATRRFAVGAATALTTALMSPALMGLWARMMARTEAPRPPKEVLSASTWAARSGSPASTSAAASTPTDARGLRSRRRQQLRGPPGALPGERSSPESSSETAPSSSSLPPLVLAPWEALALALHTVSLAFFLGSYQVHEKSVLLPALPALLLGRRLPLLAAWGSSVALWSLWPLLCRDGLAAPMCVLGAVYAAAFWPSTAAVTAGDAAVVLRALPDALRRRVFGRGGGRCGGGTAAVASAAASLSPWLRAAALLSFVPALGISLAAATVPPPPRLPDLFPYATAVYTCGLLVAAWASGTAVLVSGAVVVAESAEPTAEAAEADAT